ncbi:MAG: Hsp20/alpha crystallin family protein [bacterium]
MALPVKHRHRRGGLSRREDPWSGIASLQHEMNRLFDDIFDGGGVRPFPEEDRLSTFQPSIDVSETAKSMKVTAELPGMRENDIDVILEDGELVISGEKTEETTDGNERRYRRETRYGSFQRVIPLTGEVDADKVTASFENGVLKVTLPKVPDREGKTGKKIEITKK